MDSTEVAWKKQSPGEVQFFPDTQRFQQHSIQKSKNPEKKSNKKKVQFNCRTSSAKEQAFENEEYNSSGTVQSDTSILEDYDLASSSINILPTEVSIVDGKRICSIRATAITLIIVILIILTPVIAISVIFSKTNSQQSSSGTQTENNNRNSLSTMSTTVVVSSISVGSQSGPPCTSYTTINDPTRNANVTGIYTNCDSGPLFNASNGGSWIRFVGTGGTIITLTPPSMSHCGGYLSGWFNGTLPTTVGTAVNGTVCFETPPQLCWWFVRMSIINCGGFYIYFLPPVPACNARYCTT